MLTDCNGVDTSIVLIIHTSFVFQRNHKLAVLNIFDNRNISKTSVHIKSAHLVNRCESKNHMSKIIKLTSLSVILLFLKW